MHVNIPKNVEKRRTHHSRIIYSTVTLRFSQEINMVKILYGILLNLHYSSNCKN